MTAVTSEWLITSMPSLADQAVSFSGSSETVAAGPYYLWSSTASLSLIGAVKTAMSDAGILSPQCFISKSRKVVLSSSGTFAVNWSNTTLRDLLGFSQGNLSLESSYVADDVSPLLWSPSYPATLPTIPGVSGYPVEDLAIVPSYDGTRSSITQTTEKTHQEWRWDVVPVARVRVASGAGGGTFYEFREKLKAGGKFYWIEGIEEDEADDTIAAYASETLHGPYKPRSLPPKWYRRKIANADTLSPIRLDGHVVSEYT